jgi:hypothetical protein
MRDSMPCEVHTHTIRDDPERKKPAREAAGEATTAPTDRIPKAGPLQVRLQLLRYLGTPPVSAALR